jgi:hypothetical protein
LFCRTDDIQDNSILRRGIPVAHSIYGVASTINASIYLFIKGLQKTQSLNHPGAITVCTDIFLGTYYGQGLEIFWRDNYTCPSLEEYKQMIKRSKDRTEPCVEFNGTLGCCILLPDIQIVRFNSAMFSAAVIVHLQKQKRSFLSNIFITKNKVKRRNM